MRRTLRRGAIGLGSSLRSAELIAMLSIGTDLGTAQPREHALRTCIVALRLGDALGLQEAQLKEKYYVALLRVIGCTADAHIVASVLGDELAARSWLARAETGNPASVLTALVRQLGEDIPPIPHTVTRCERIPTAHDQPLPARCTSL